MFKPGKPETSNIGDLLVWHDPQVGSGAGLFFAPVPNIETAKHTLDLLAYYDLWQFENRIKGDYANASGLMHYVGTDSEIPDHEGWEEWSNDQGLDIQELMAEDEAEAEEEAERAIVVAEEKLLPQKQAERKAMVQEVSNFLQEKFSKADLRKHDEPIWIHLTDTNSGRGVIPYFLFREGTSARAALEDRLTCDLDDAISIGTAISWKEIVSAITGEARRGTDVSAYTRFIEYLLDNKEVRDLFMGHFLFYGNNDDTSHVYSAMNHGYDYFYEHGQSPRGRLETLRTAMDWYNSYRETITDIRGFDAQYGLRSAADIMRYYSMITGLEIKNVI